MEGRACGCHVIAFDIGDTRRIVADGGSVVRPGDSDALSEALATAVRASAEGVLARSPSRFPSVAEYAATLDALGHAR
jgi:glycosyltransferase involved in cell wall biosynthesis